VVVLQLDSPHALDQLLVAVPDHDLAHAVKIVALELGDQFGGGHRCLRCQAPFADGLVA
jgi:hypothetical protein